MIDLQQCHKIFNVENFVSFPILIKRNFNSIIEEPCAENIFIYLLNKAWLSEHIFSKRYILSENFNSLGLFFIIFLLFIILYFQFSTFVPDDHVLFFLKWWHASRSLGLTSFPVRDSPFQISLTQCLIAPSELGRFQSFLVTRIEHYPRMIAPNQQIFCAIMKYRFWKSATQKKHDQILKLRQSFVCQII